MGARFRGSPARGRRAWTPKAAPSRDGARDHQSVRAGRAGRASIPANRNDLYPSVVALTVAAGDDAFELGEGQVHHAPVARVHRLEGDDFTLFHGLAAEPLSHGRERVVTAAAVALGIHEDVAPIEARAIDDPVRQELQRLQHLALLADDTPRVAAGDLDVDLVVRVALLRAAQVHGALHLHLADHVIHELQRDDRALVRRHVVVLALAAARALVVGAGNAEGGVRDLTVFGFTFCFGVLSVGARVFVGAVPSFVVEFVVVRHDSAFPLPRSGLSPASFADDEPLLPFPLEADSPITFTLMSPLPPEPPPDFIE